MKILKIYILLLSVLLLGACQNKAPVQSQKAAVWLSEKSYFDKAYSVIKNQQYKKLSAKVSVKTNDLNEQASMVWLVNAGEQEMTLYGPLGAGATKLSFGPAGAQLIDSKGKIQYRETIEQLLLEVVGWPIPVDALSYWLFAVPEPSLQAKHAQYRYQLNQQGRLAVLEQNDWRIEYVQYQRYEQTIMPRKIVVKKQLDGQQELIVKLIVKKWQWQ